MSEFNKTCTTCQKPISLSDKSGRWLPYNLDGTQHFCKDNNRDQKVKEDMIPVPKSVLTKMVEFIEGVEAIKHRLGVALGEEK